MKNLSIFFGLIPMILASPTPAPATIQQILRPIPQEARHPNGTLSISSTTGLLQSLDHEGRVLSSRALAPNEIDVIQTLENDQVLSEMIMKRNQEVMSTGAGDGDGPGEVVKYPGGRCSPAVVCRSSEICGRGECSDCVQIGWFPIRFCQ